MKGPPADSIHFSSICVISNSKYKCSDMYIRYSKTLYKKKQSHKTWKRDAVTIQFIVCIVIAQQRSLPINSRDKYLIVSYLGRLRYPSCPLLCTNLPPLAVGTT